MDLFAYYQIDNLKHILNDNNIKVPRIRGLRLMSDETETYTRTLSETDKCFILENLVNRNYLLTNPRCTHDRLATLKRYIEYSTVDENSDELIDAEPIRIKWENIHGKKRKRIKLAIKHQEERVKKQFEAWNRHVGESSVLYIHSRMGGSNWSFFGGSEIATQPWFIEKVDDSVDSTYCDIYARIN